jgi:quercetin dioxygenase-like cupin family protein
MEKFFLDEMVRGWFVGNFNPSVYKTEDVEVAIQEYKKGDKEEWHLHKIATEITVILKGEVLMNKENYKEGDIVKIPPNEGTDFVCLEDTIAIVVKLPGALNDKYLKNSEKI